MKLDDRIGGHWPANLLALFLQREFAKGHLEAIFEGLHMREQGLLRVDLPAGEGDGLAILEKEGDAVPPSAAVSTEFQLAVQTKKHRIPEVANRVVPLPLAVRRGFLNLSCALIDAVELIERFENRCETKADSQPGQGNENGKIIQEPDHEGEETDQDEDVRNAHESLLDPGLIVHDQNAVFSSRKVQGQQEG